MNFDLKLLIRDSFMDFHGSDSKPQPTQVENITLNPIVQSVYTMARILESGLNLVHPYSRNKSDKEDCLFFIPILIHDIY